MVKKLTGLLLLSLLLMACGGKGKKNLAEEDAGSISINDFIEYFDEVQLPLAFTDTIFTRKQASTSLITHKIFDQFIGDSIFKPVYGKEKAKIYALGRFRNKDKETYLLIRTVGSTNAVYAIALTPENKYSAQMLLISNKRRDNEIDRVTIDKRFTFNLVDEYKANDGTIAEYNNVYAYNTAGLFMIIMTDGLKRGTEMAIINPIDTFPANNKYSGNYGKDKKNFISIRDGKSPKDFIFFLNFDKGGSSECHGELKGEAVFVTKDSAVFKTNGDPCTIGFKFNTASITIKEVANCGNRRPMECSLNAWYKKLKTPVKKDAADTKKKTTPKKKH